jgi:cell division septum initiation protein DivIVA
MNKALCTILLIIGFTEVFAQVNLTLDEYNQFVDEKKRLKNTVEQCETDIIDLTSQIDSLSSTQKTLTRSNLKLKAERENSAA